MARPMLLLLLAVLSMAAQTIEGTVRNDTADAPLAGVTVRILQGDKVMYRAVTGEQGEFRIDGVAPGEYTADYAKAGFVAPRPGTSARRPFQVANGGPAIHLEASLDAFGKISGRVTGAGRPIPHAEVYLQVFGTIVGVFADTDEAGAFHINDVEPGVYVLSARAPLTAPPLPDEAGRKLAWAQTWYPSASDRLTAARIIVSGGAELVSQDISLGTAPARRVKGRVVSDSGQAVQGAAISAVSPDEMFPARFAFRATSGTAGEFEFAALPEGDWRFSAEADSPGSKRYLQIVETVTGRDLEGLELRLTAPFPVSGRIIFDGPAAPDARKPTSLMLAPQGGGDHLSWTTAAPDGAFRFDNVAPGSYRFMPINPGPPYYLASVQVGDREVLGEYVELSTGTLPVTITYRSDGGTVRGSVENCGKAVVVLAPQNSSLQYPEFIRRTTCREGGQFEIRGLRPGDYYAFAFDREPGMLETSSFAQQWVNSAERITIRANEATRTILKVTERGAF
jgi:hypothetical protein